MNYINNNKQRGAALITSLLIVVVISILGVAVGKQVIALKKVSTVNYDYTLSLDHAESALATVGSVFDANITSPDVIEALSTPLQAGSWWRDINNWGAATDVTQVEDVAVSPAYLIEDSGLDTINLAIGDPTVIRMHYYRVTARAQGKGESVAFLQAYYATPE
ncbi:hypothetical protein GCM10007916_06090 [Psychromonas marina]|uniref:PilX/PilW C-terminal domain-containing protein n=1 Tax=Psychromonas marina TaxID=88364 RepID=A0ABQ6DWN3_9GAMM|nr:hypothetical protein [Psychromonas marina]GLS89542.1 hypothetical protein GCM10007916_06090 [Psychromonas marina]